MAARARPIGPIRVRCSAALASVWLCLRTKSRPWTKLGSADFAPRESDQRRGRAWLPRLAPGETASLPGPRHRNHFRLAAAPQPSAKASRPFGHSPAHPSPLPQLGSTSVPQPRRVARGFDSDSRPRPRPPGSTTHRLLRTGHRIGQRLCRKRRATPPARSARRGDPQATQ